MAPPGEGHKSVQSHMSTEAPNESTLDPTLADGGNVGTTHAAADKAATTPQPEGGNQPDIDKIVKTRLDRERKKWEAESAEAAKRARMDEAERLKAELADRDTKIAAAEAKALAAERIAELTGKVIDPKAALRLWEEDDTLDTFLKRHPYMAPKQTSAVDIPGSKTTGSVATNPWSRNTRNLTEQARITKENPALARQLIEAAR